MTIPDLDRVTTGLLQDELGSGSGSDVVASSGRECATYDLSLVVWTILPGTGTESLSVATNTGSSSSNVGNSEVRCLLS